MSVDFSREICTKNPPSKQNFKLDLSFVCFSLIVSNSRKQWD